MTSVPIDECIVMSLDKALTIYEILIKGTLVSYNVVTDKKEYHDTRGEIAIIKCDGVLLGVYSTDRGQHVNLICSSRGVGYRVKAKDIMFVNAHMETEMTKQIQIKGDNLKCS